MMCIWVHSIHCPSWLWDLCALFDRNWLMHVNRLYWNTCHTWIILDPSIIFASATHVPQETRHWNMSLNKTDIVTGHFKRFMSCDGLFRWNAPKTALFSWRWGARTTRIYTCTVIIGGVSARTWVLNGQFCCILIESNDAKFYNASPALMRCSQKWSGTLLKMEKR